MSDDDLVSQLWESPELLDFQIMPLKNGMVVITLGETSICGTYLDTIDLASRLMHAAAHSAHQIGVSRERLFKIVAPQLFGE